MTDDGRDTTRRTYLKIAGSAAVAGSLAGCAGGNSQISKNSGERNAGGETAGGKSTTSSKSGGGAAKNSGFPVTVTLSAPPSTLDPQDHRSIPTENVVRQAYEGLIARDPKGNVINMLAKKYERIEPGRMRFHLRNGVTFHSGNKLTPEDAAFSVNRIVKPKVSINSPQASQLAGVTGAEVVDGKHAIDVLSDGANPLVIAQFATYGDVMEKAWVKKHDSSYIATHMNGTGPFKMTNYQQNVRVVFERNENYWDKPAAVSKLTMNAAKSSSARVNSLIERETDLTVNVPPDDIPRVKKSGTARVGTAPSTRVLYNAMRYDAEPFSSPKFRQAMNYAIDLESIVKNILLEFGDATSQPTLQGFFGFNEQVDPYPHDPKKAAQLVEESGQSGASITLHTPVGRYLKDVQIAQAVVGMIDELPNVSAQVRQREFNALASELTDGKLDTGPKFYLIGWGNATFDAAKTILPTLTCDGTLTSYCNKEVDSLVRGSLDVTNDKKRKSMLEKANQILHDEAPWIFLNRQFGIYGIGGRIAWEPRRDERIDAYGIKPK
ncbi:MAG TPA: ABC transporter substrate-binding protein [Halococcus sp.]|nr:ABC transporter substrate-binding protein [Halococcus sp.]